MFLLAEVHKLWTTIIVHGLCPETVVEFALVHLWPVALVGVALRKRVLEAHKEVIHAQYPSLVTIETLIQHPQDADLHQGLVKICRLVLDDLKSDLLVLTMDCGMALQYLSE